MGKKDASTVKLPVDQYRKQIGHYLTDDQINTKEDILKNVGKQDNKKTKPALRAARLRAEAKRSAPGIRDILLIIVTVLIFLLVIYAIFYLNLSTELNLDSDMD